MAGIDDWLQVARGEDDEVRERILTGYKDGKPFTPYVPTIAWPSNIRSVLDFGCGLGRNFPHLRSVAHALTGFDLPPMIERCRAIAAAPGTTLTDNWSEVRERRYDLIVATLVLQHLEPDACRSYLQDFARLAPVTYVLTRVMSDFDENVLELVSETGAFETGSCVEVEHDPSTHQLRVLGRTSFDELRQATSGGHYEVLLRTRG